VGVADATAEKPVAIVDGRVGLFASDTDVSVDSLSIFGRDP
jgi:hypothetical protein